MPDGTAHRSRRVSRGMAEISLESLSKVFPDGTNAVSDLDLVVDDGEFVVLVGPSGCGKTTALRMVAGLEEPTSGEIRIGGDLVTNVPPKKRDIAMVFQDYALYPQMTVFDNMAFALKLQKMPKAQDQGAGPEGGGDPSPRGTAPSSPTRALGRAAPAGRHGSRDRSRTAERSCSTSRCRTWTRSFACRCAQRSRVSSETSVSRRSTSRTIRPRR